jgi:hypothetical protein
MPMPLKHKKSRQNHRKEGVEPDPTAKYRMGAWRKRKLDAAAKAGYEEKCAREMESLRRIGNPFVELFDMIGIKSPYSSFEFVRKAWKATLVTLHPDRGGDPAKAARLNQLWQFYKQRNPIPLEERSNADKET